MTTLYPFQRDGIATIVKHGSLLLADEMGLGKTVQAICAVNDMPDVRRVLVICPASLKNMWRDAILQWSSRRAYVSVGRSRRAGTVDSYGVERGTQDVYYLILNYDVVSAWRAKLDNVSWHMLICDEAHYLKNPESKRTIAVCGDDRKRTPGLPAWRVVMLTGTPILNKPVELWPLLHKLDARTWPKFWPFAMRYCGAYQDHFGWHFDGASHLDELSQKLRIETGGMMLRRTKGEVLTDLPAKTRMLIPLSPNAPSTKLLEQEAATLQAWEHHLEEAARNLKTADTDKDYNSAVKALRSTRHYAIEELSRIRHDLALQKVVEVVRHVEMLLNSGVPKIAVWAHHHDVLDALAKALCPTYSVVSIDGRTPVERRSVLVRQFQEGAARVFVGGITAAGVGITLHAANVAVFAELDWVPANLSQAEDRLHRIGQREPVIIQHIVYDGSLDARMAKRVLEKQAIIDQTLGGMPDEEPVSPFDNAA